MAGVIESDDYRNTREQLKADPIIQQMAEEIDYVDISEITHGGDYKSPKYEFMMGALDEYKGRGGKIGSHIGGPAEAILMIIKDKHGNQTAQD